MSEATSSFDGSERNEILAEASRQDELARFPFSDILHDAELLRFLQQARSTIKDRPEPDDSRLVKVIHNDLDQGIVTSYVSRNLVLIIAELYHLVRDTLAQRWKERLKSVPHPELFHPVELPSADIVDELLPDEITRETSKRVQEYVGVALDLTRRKIHSDLMEANAPSPDMVQGLLHLNNEESRDVADLVLDGVRSRLEKLFSTPPVHIARSMKEWRDWSPYINVASENDVHEIHDLYGEVLMPREELVKLDPRFAAPSEFSHVSDHVRNRGAMFKALRDRDGDNEVVEGLRRGRIAIVREKPGNNGSPEERRQLLGFYNVISDAEAVREHMKRELHFSCNTNAKYGNTSELPRFSRIEEPGGEIRTINYSDEEGALRVFRAASEGKLAWSVDHAVRMDGPEKLRRYAMLGTALKLDEYEYLHDHDGKTIVIMKVATVIGVDASAAAGELGMQQVDPSEWVKDDGECPWKVDQTGMVVLPRAITNVGSTTLNTRLGASEVFTMTEEFMRDGVRVRILWRYLAQHLPPDTP